MKNRLSRKGKPAPVAGLELGSPEWWEQLTEYPALMATQVCEIDMSDFEGMLERHASLHAWVNATHEAARVEEDRAQWEVTREQAMQTLHFKGVPDATTGKLPTVEVLKAEVNASEQVKAAMEKLFDAQQKRGALRAMADALEDRLQMLIQLSALRRREMEVDRHQA